MQFDYFTRLILKFPATALLHLALLIIVAGAVITHFCGITGKITLTANGLPTREFTVESGPSDGKLPFSVQLQSAETLFHKSSTTPQDYKTTINVFHNGGETETASISMNKVAVINGWRFYQTGMGDNTSLLSVSHDPVGIGVTYSGYTLLMLSMLLFFLQKRSTWRVWLHRLAISTAALLIFLQPGQMHAQLTKQYPLPTLQCPLAKSFGDIYVYWNNRVVPMQTMAIDVVTCLYNSTSYHGMTPLQVLTGWLFYYDDWKRDFDSACDSHALTGKKLKRYQEKIALIKWLGTGEAFRIYPYHSASGNLEWLSLAGKRPSKMEIEQWKFMVKTMPDIASDIYAGSNISANNRVKTLIALQKNYAGVDFLPSDNRIRAEKFYNSYVHLLPIAITALLLGIIAMIISSKGLTRISDKINLILSLISFLYITSILALRGYISSHVPLSNGFETMLAMAAAAFLLAVIVPRRFPQLNSALLIVAGTAVAVAVMTNTRPQIGELIPVLNSRLLSIHVMLIMLSYCLFFLIAILSIKILLTKSESEQRKDIMLNHILLLPAVFLLSAGIFIGAVWANQSWGRYWGWDPKETCALVTMIVYAIPLHSRSLKIFNDDKIFAIYTLTAFSCVIFTYFGANYLLPGLHSYA